LFVKDKQKTTVGTQDTGQRQTKNNYKNITESLMMNNTDPINKSGVNPCAREGASYKTI
jgi:hypothetical protein